MFFSSSGKNLFCSSGDGGQEQVVHDGSGVMPPMMMTGDDELEGIGRGDDVTSASGGRGVLDEVVVSALKNLSFEERQRHLNEQHGIQENFENIPPEFVAHKLNELETQLDTQLRTIMSGGPFPWSPAAPDSPPGILLARAMDPNFMQNSYRLRLRVLRAEYYDAAKAAARLIRYFDVKKEIFGPERIAKQITFDDLSEDDVDALYKGFFQYIQGRDAVGRRIFVIFPHQFEGNDPKSMARLFFYYDTFVNQNEFDKGYVLLGFRLGSPSKDVLEKQNRIAWLIKSVMACPDSQSATHACFYPHDRFHIATKPVFLMLSPDMRAKTKIHVGSQTEWLYALMGYGINEYLVPISSSGEIKLKQHHAFIDYRKILEKRCVVDPFFTPIEIPNNYDVLFGRGRSFRHQKGNQRLHFLIDENASRYNSCKSGKEKNKVIGNVIQGIKTFRGARFLSQDQSTLWIEVDDVTVKEKLAQMFRNVRKRYAASMTATTATIGKTTKTIHTQSPFSEGSDGGIRKKRLDEGDQGASIAQDDIDDSQDSLSMKRPRRHTFDVSEEE